MKHKYIPLVAAYLICASAYAQYADVSTLPAGNITSYSASLRYSVISYEDTLLYFTYGSTSMLSTGSGTISASSTRQYGGLTVIGLTPNTLYYFECVASNLFGIIYGGTLTFVTPALPPLANTGNADSITEASANLSGSINPQGTPALAYFEYGITTNYGRFTTSNSVPAGTTYQNVQLTITNLAINTTYHYHIAAINSAGTVYGADMAFTTSNGVPSITQQPTGMTVQAGSNVVLSVVARGAIPLSYQWRLNTSNLPGATLTNFTITNAQPSDTGNYTVVITNAFGSITSSAAALTVQALPPIITTQPLSLTNVEGSAATFSVAAKGTAPLRYQWRFNTTNLAGATLDNYTIGSVQLNNAGSYTVVITNDAGSVTSSAAALTVIRPPSITLQPQTRFVCTGSPAALSIAATGTAPLTYQWRKSGAPIAGATATILAIASVGANDSAGYDVLVSNWAGTTTSSITYLNIYSIISQPQNKTVLLGSPATLTCEASCSSPFSYQWTRDGASIRGATTTTLTLPSVSYADAAEYGVVLSNQYGTVGSFPSRLFVSSGTLLPDNRNNTGIPAGCTNIVSALFYYGVYALRQDGTTIGLVDTNGVPGTNIIAIDSSAYAILALKANGSLTPLLRAGTAASSLTNEAALYNIPAGLTNVVAIAANCYGCGAALRRNGDVATWGNPNSLGNTNVLVGLHNVVRITGGYGHFLALKQDGTVIGWGGDNFLGETTPPAGLSNVVAIAAAYGYSLALTSNGTVVEWGDILGTRVPAGLTNAIAIFPGPQRHLALQKDGSMTSWGILYYKFPDFPANISNVCAVILDNKRSATYAICTLAIARIAPPSIVSFQVNINHYYQMLIAGNGATNILIQVKSNVLQQSWDNLATNPVVNGQSTFTESNTLNYPRRFYRVVASP